MTSAWFSLQIKDFDSEAEWWSGGFPSPSGYFKLRRRQLAAAAARAPPPPGGAPPMWRDDEGDGAPRPPSALLARRGLPPLAPLRLPVTCTNIAALESCAGYLGDVAVALVRPTPAAVDASKRGRTPSHDFGAKDSGGGKARRSEAGAEPRGAAAAVSTPVSAQAPARGSPPLASSAASSAAPSRSWLPDAPSLALRPDPAHLAADPAAAAELRRRHRILSERAFPCVVEVRPAAAAAAEGRAPSWRGAVFKSLGLDFDFPG